MKELLLLLPNLAVLLGRLLADPSVPGTAKVALGAMAAYLVSPVDLIPDFIPFVGYLDDLILVAIIVDGLLNHLDRDLLRKHWPGDPVTLEKSAAVARRLSAWVPARIKAKVFGRQKEAA
ncbi:MAG: DUF1232 domain-containing protein [Candidatus Rokubacteria bacterium]|nr:DUF1232 domain-containing protein [Candidatus Rokubacteria bacterium]MBI2554613.1 DUF1232 domain-containing protein [Candidatus Rokubacteria bacterium]